MDLGFGQLIEKFEEHVGKTPTKLLLYVVFVAVFALCMKAIIDNLIAPAMGILDTPLFGSTLIKLALMALSVGLGVGVGAQALAAFGEWKSLKKAKGVLRDAESMVDRIEAESTTRHEATKVLFAEIRSLSDRAQGLMLASMNVTEELSKNSELTDEQRALLQSLIGEIKDSLAGAEDAAAVGEDNRQRIVALDKVPRKKKRVAPRRPLANGDAANSEDTKGV